MKHLQNENGFTMVELTVAMCVMSILFFMAIPQYRVAMEQAKVDFAATTLKSIWTAERMYWVQNRSFCADLTVLESNQLLEPGFSARLNAVGTPFHYSVIAADANSFSALAESTKVSWVGSFTITEQGLLTGEVDGAHGAVVTASVL